MIYERPAWEFTLRQYIAGRRKELTEAYGKELDRDGWKALRAGLPLEWEREVSRYPRGEIIRVEVFRCYARIVGYREACRMFRWAGNAAEITKRTPSLIDHAYTSELAKSDKALERAWPAARMGCSAPGTTGTD